jgi:hypothetical protein
MKFKKKNQIKIYNNKLNNRKIPFINKMNKNKNSLLRMIKNINLKYKIRIKVKIINNIKILYFMICKIKIKKWFNKLTSITNKLKI